MERSCLRPFGLKWWINPGPSGADVSHGAVDFAFIGSSIAASSAPFSPVPEASTIAVLFAGLFVGGLAFKRVRDSRQAALVAA